MILCPVCRSPQARRDVRDEPPVWLCPCGRLFYRDRDVRPDSGLCGWAFFAERRRGSDYLVPLRPASDASGRFVERTLRDWVELALTEEVLDA